ncbi:MAG: YfiR family protein [Bacteroidia bacterium]|nr:YfiR family protein [Bacteroidia bacterium]
MKHLALIAAALVFLSAQRIDPKEDTNAKIKAVYLYNFSKYVEWPEDYKNGNFVVTVVGPSSSLLSELDKMAQKKVGSQPIAVKSVSSPSALEKSNIIFMPFESSALLTDVINKIKGQSTLIVTEKAGLTKLGAAINFIIKDNKQLFELSKSNAERYKLKISSNLYALAIKVE